MLYKLRTSYLVVSGVYGLEKCVFDIELENAPLNILYYRISLRTTLCVVRKKRIMKPNQWVRCSRNKTYILDFKPLV